MRRATITVIIIIFALTAKPAGDPASRAAGHTTNWRATVICSTGFVGAHLLQTAMLRGKTLAIDNGKGPRIVPSQRLNHRAVPRKLDYLELTAQLALELH